MLEGLIRLTIGALATWRISVMAWYEDGPFDVYKSIRFWIKGKGTPKGYNKDGELALKHDYFWEFILSQVSCFWCVSLWVGAFISPIIVVPFPIYLTLIPFALSAITMLLSGTGRTIWRLTTEHRESKEDD